MKYSITYGRKVATKQYESLEISIVYEFDSANIDCEKAKDLLKSLVDRWIEEERSRLLKE